MRTYKKTIINPLFLLLPIFILSLSSCFQMSSDINIGADGSIEYNINMDLKDAIPLLEMSLEMEKSHIDLRDEDEKAADAKNVKVEDKFEMFLNEALLKPTDTLMTMYDLMSKGEDEGTPALYKENNKVRLVSDVDNDIFKMDINYSFQNINEQKLYAARFDKALQEKMEETGELEGPMEDMNVKGMFINELDLEKGILRAGIAIDVPDSLSEEDINMNQLMGGMMGKTKYRFNLPGKIISITTKTNDNHKIVDEYTAVIETAVTEKTMMELEELEIRFQPKSVFMNPVSTEVWDPVPEKVSFGNNNAPSDAIVLIQKDLSKHWHTFGNKPPGWKVSDDGIMTVTPQSGGIFTNEKFGDVQLHVEWRTDPSTTGEGQDRGNSGVFLQSKYEVQVLDNYENVTYPNGQAGSIYKQYIPLVNASKKTGEWQAYDIIYHAPVFDKVGTKIKSGTMTVIHNGVLIQDHVEIKGTSEYIGKPKNESHGPLPLMLQDHGEPVSYRNIWVRRL